MENIINNLNVQTSTKRNYRNGLKRLVEFGYTENTTLEELKKILDKNLETPVQKQLLLNVVIVIMRGLDKNYDEYKEYRAELSLEEVPYKHKKLMEKKEKLSQITLEEYKNEIQSIFNIITLTDKPSIFKFRKYIINYLFLNYCVRNMDVMCKVLEEDDEEGNRLIIKKDYVLYIRREYKTQFVYGTQKHKIRNKKFNLVMKKYVNLFGYGNYIVKDTNQIRSAYILGLKENEVCKMMIDYFYKQKNTEKIRLIAKLRGTMMRELDASYNLNQEEKIIY
jgi:hypothetical protein